ncbi:TPA: SIR2 family protein [Campylobacter jejuni]|nr:SIR2 family protein [Campylobacter jejuni]HDZ5075735.1 SIR2 family protein [Campylobacter jejuni]HDZ5154081.1 SIR2 family protein [Campylobacter jejuni]
MSSSDIFFFGAGFSKSLNDSYPTLAELSEYFLNNKFIKKHEEIYKDNLEQLLTYLITPLPFKTKEDILRDEASYIEKIDKISDYFMKLREDIAINQNNKDVLTLSKYINKNKCTCITLNYDLLLEEMLFLTKKYESYNVYYKIPIKSINGRMQTESRGFNFYQSNFNNEINSSTEIIKLHGSINWYYDQIYKNSQIYSYSAVKINKNSKLYSITPYKEELFIDLKPLIIPPILDKTNNYNHILLQSLWRKAFKAIQKAKNIYIYGFSFPLTDLSVVYLFKSALHLNKQDYKIYVINTESNIEDKKKRYNEIFGEGKCNFSFCCSDNLEKLAEHLNKKSPESI